MPNDKPLAGKVALVTGSSRKLGKYMALHLAELGAHVAVHYNSNRLMAQRVVEKTREKGVKSRAFRADISKSKEAAALIASVVRNFGRLDVLVNNVGNYLKKPVSRTREEEWLHVLDTNLNCTFYCTKYALPFMRRQGFGRVISIGFSPIGKIQAMPEVTPYFIAKTGVLLYMKAVAHEEAGNGITANVISPGHTFDSLGNRSESVKKIPAGRLAKPRDFYPVIDLIVSEESSYITGNHFIVSGGYNI